MQTKSLDMRGKYLSLIFTGWLISAAVNASEDHNWSYSGESGPANWAALEKNSSCGGSAQSPVNIIAANAQPDANRNRPLALDYRQRTLINNVINNGHSIQFDFAAGDALAYQGRRFDLMQIHFHSPSEHTLNGIRYPVELHLVHINKAEAEYTVLAFFGFEGRSLNIKAIEQNIPAQTGESLNIGKAIDFSKLFPRHLTPRFEYTGSLTTPPCTEGVNWIIFEDPIELSKDTLDVIRQAMPVNNYRNTQPLNGRTAHWVVN
jgi:carbonic anhydrase